MTKQSEGIAMATSLACSDMGRRENRKKINFSRMDRKFHVLLAVGIVRVSGHGIFRILRSICSKHYSQGIQENFRKLTTKRSRKIFMSSLLHKSLLELKQRRTWSSKKHIIDNLWMLFSFCNLRQIDKCNSKLQFSRMQSWRHYLFCWKPRCYTRCRKLP